MEDVSIPSYERKRASIERQYLRKSESHFRAAQDDIQNRLRDYYEKYAVNGEIPPARLNKYNRLQKLEELISKDIQKAVLATQRTLRSGVSAASFEAFTLMAYGISKKIDATLAWSYSQTRALESILEYEFSAFNKNTKTFSRLNQQTVQKIRSMVVSGLLNRRHYNEIARDINTYMRSTGRGLRPTIARLTRTEIGRALEVGSQMAYDDANRMGLVVKKRWLATKDDRVRDSHLSLDGKLEDEDGMFWSGTSFAPHPHAFGVASEDINCRCTTIASIDDSKPQKRYVREEGVVPFTSFSVDET